MKYFIKQKIKDFFKTFGYVPIRPTVYHGKARFHIEGLHYDCVVPYANFAPWTGDNEFLDLFNKIKNFTLVDIFRCYELWQLSQQAIQNQSGAILEVGVWRGGTAGIFAKRLKLSNKNNLLYLADTFEGVVKTSSKDAFYSGAEHNDTNQETVEELMKIIDFTNYQILKGIFPEDTGHLIPSGQMFSICHIDVDVYLSAKDVMNWVWERLLPGGIIIFDDYGFHSCTGITRLVDEQRLLKDRLIIHNLNGHAIIIKA